MCEGALTTVSATRPARRTASQGMHADTLFAPDVVLYVPAMQEVQLVGPVAPARIPYVPAGQGVHVAGEAAPSVPL